MRATDSGRLVNSRSRIAATVGTVCAAVLASLPLSAFASSASTPSMTAAAADVDGVHVTISTPFLPSQTHNDSVPGSATQAASFATMQPYGEFTLIAVPYGTRPSSDEELPIAEGGGAPGYLAALRQLRSSQGGTPVAGPNLSIFGQPTASIEDIVSLQLSGPPAVPLVIVEAVADAGNRLWVLRMVRQEQPTTQQSDDGTFVGSLGGMNLSSSNLSAPTTLVAPSPPTPTPTPTNTPTPSPTAVPSAVMTPSTGQLQSPPWWSSPPGKTCDYNTYYNGSGGWQSYQLGTANYLGVIACGPRPYYQYENAPDVNEYFHPIGAPNDNLPESEWECAELSKRFMYLEYGTPNYPANGNAMLSGYLTYELQPSKYQGGTRLEVVYNPGYNHQPIQYQTPVAGDVLSFGPTTGSGHTAVVISTAYNGAGGGTLRVLEQNLDRSGTETLTMSNWTVQPNEASENVQGWLHNPSSPAAVSSWPGSQLDVYSTERDGNADGTQDGSANVYHSWEINGTWTTAADSGGPQGTVASSPAVVVGGYHSGQVDLFVRDEYDQLWHGWGCCGTWSWENISAQYGGTIAGNPTVMSWTPGNLEVFARGEDGYVQHWWQNQENGGTTAWGHEEFAPGQAHPAQQIFGDPVAQAWPTTNGFHTFYQGTDHTLREIDWSFGGSEVPDEVPTSGTNVYSNPAPVLNPGASWENIGFLDPSGNLFTIGWSAAGWSAPAQQASGAALSPTATAWGPSSGGYVGWFYESTAFVLNAVYCCNWGSVNSGNVITSQPAAVTWNGNNSVDVFARGTDGLMWDYNCCSRNGGNWAWTQVTNSHP